MYSLRDVEFEGECSEWLEKLLAALLPEVPLRATVEPPAAQEEPEQKTINAYAMTTFKQILEVLINKGWDLQEAMQEVAGANLGVTVGEGEEQQEAMLNFNDMCSVLPYS